MGNETETEQPQATAEVAPAAEGGASTRQMPKPSAGNGSLSPNPPAPEAKAPANSDVGIDIIKPKNDDMQYKHLVLENGLKVVLISDPTADKAGAALDVNVGSMCDPEAFPGLAHFLEHMLFYSSQKYPVEDEYTKFITDHGGSTNAYTAPENTNYHFDCNWDALPEALDRFAQFFICPTISADGIEREVRAIDSEHGKNLVSDAWRKAQVNKATANQAHAWARFHTGSRDTLYVQPQAAGLDPREAVVRFHSQHYSANLGGLAVLGRQPLGELEGMVRSMFSAVPSKQLTVPEFPGELFLPDQCGVLLRIVPVRDGQSLELSWQLPPSHHHFRSQPLNYLSHLLGHEGEGSLFALLKALGWASALWAGEAGMGLSCASVFTLHIDLTQEGERSIQQVGALAFKYLALLRQPGGISQDIWEEVRGLAQLAFDTRDKSRPMPYCSLLSAGLHDYPPQHLLQALMHVPQEFDAGVVGQYLSLLTLERVRATWVSKKHDQQQQPKAADADAADVTAGSGSGDGGAATPAPAVAAEGAAGASAAPATADAQAPELQTEVWYGTRYSVERLPQAWLHAWADDGLDPRLHLPAPNPFIPTDLSLLDPALEPAAHDPTAPPQCAMEVAGRLRLWHKPDTSFKQPKMSLYLEFQSPEAYASPHAAVMTNLFVKLMMDYMNEIAYPAHQAGLDYNMVNTRTGWQLLLGGYSHKLALLLQAILDKLASFKVAPDRFEFVRESATRDYNNQVHVQPYSWALYRRELLASARRWPLEAYPDIARSATPEQLQAFFGRLTSRVCVEGLVAGNVSCAAAQAIGEQLVVLMRDKLGAAPVPSYELPELRAIKLPPCPRAAAATTSAAPSAPGAASLPGAQPIEPAAATATAASGADGAAASGSGVAPPPAGPVDSAAAEEAKATASSSGGEAAPLLPGGWLFSEAGPSAKDENSAAITMFQANPDSMAGNAACQLLVQLAKRDAFHELRTQQQLGYIVSLHGGDVHGVRHVELLVQSNTFSASELTTRMDGFVARLLRELLPAKCSSPSAAPQQPAVEQPQQQQQEAAGSAGEAEAAPAAAAAAAGNGSSTSCSEFEKAVEELAKSKLEKPKKLGELVQRWWHEIQEGSLCFDRQQQEVAALRALTPEQLLAFAHDLMAGPSCRKLLVQVRGTAEIARQRQPASADEPGTADAAAAATPAAAAPADAASHETAAAASKADAGATAPPAVAPAAPAAEPALPISDWSEWKRGCEAWPTLRALWQQQRQQQQRQ